MREIYFVTCMLFDSLEDPDYVLNLRKIISAVFACALINI